MEDWFRRKGYLAADETLRIEELSVPSAESRSGH